MAENSKKQLHICQNSLISAEAGDSTCILAEPMKRGNGMADNRVMVWYSNRLLIPWVTECLTLRSPGMAD